MIDMQSPFQHLLFEVPKLSEYLRYQRTQSRIISGSKWHHLNGLAFLMPEAPLLVSKYSRVHYSIHLFSAEPQNAHLLGIQVGQF